MTDEQITALACEYAEEKGKEMEQKHSLPNGLIKEVMEMDVKELTRFLKWLLRRYCLVEKKRVTELYKHELLNKRVNAHCGVKNDADAARLDLLKSLFHVIGKEVEE